MIPVLRSALAKCVSHLILTNFVQLILGFFYSRPPRVSIGFEAKFHALEKSQKSLIQQTKLEGQLEYLSVSKSSSEQFWITVEGKGQPFIRMPFDTAEFCFEAALELEDTFDILLVIELRPGETMERIEEMIGVWLDREQVARVWG